MRLVYNIQIVRHHHNMYTIELDYRTGKAGKL